MTYAELRRDLLNSAANSPFMGYGICKDTAAALIAAERFHVYNVESEIAYWNSIDEYYDAETREQYSKNAAEYEELASLYYQYANENGAAYML